MFFFFSPSMLEQLSENDSVSMVTFLDVLGWKGIYKQKADAIISLGQIIEKGNTVCKEVSQLKDNKKVNAEIKSISDTIVVLSKVEFPNNTKRKEKTKKTLNKNNFLLSLKAHGEIAKSMVQEGLKKGILLRGATAIGEYEEKGNILLGESIDEAAEWHEQVNWCGVILSPRTYMILKAITNDSAKETKLVSATLKLWIEYNRIPFKIGGTAMNRCLNWTGGDVRRNLQNIILEAGAMNTNIANKYLNTIEFINSISNKSED